ncbi:sensor histidine kinase [Clavibacter michiganensis]|uniref:Sensor-like histidine kinase SenX3 n=1 Tax=Clavibacter michiganensis TaxID=28447 RepID=A0A251YMT3_9MICO|nr:ATP-binding protein [Clavibacter michiganensis]OUE25540.1 Signal-transduction histidine kinase senX3 [Clavibacter michiganensis]
MDTGALVLVCLLIGLAVGAGFVWLLHHAADRGDRAVEITNPVVPDGVDQVLEALESAGIVLDPSNNVMKASPGAISSGLVFHQALVHPELVSMVDRVRRSGEPMADEVSLARGPFGAAEFQMHVRVARLGARYVLLLAQDRTESHRLDQVRRDFVANISHELKTPIGAVGLLAEALDSCADDAVQVRRFAARLTTESARLARITQEIIELSRLEASNALEKAEPVDVDHVISVALDQVRLGAELRGIELARGKRSRSTVYGDEALLVVAVHNLLSNAVNYSPDGSRVGIGVMVDDGAVEIVVTDQGIGIPEDEQGRIFERFFRVDQARARDTGGTGLGLSIVKHVVQNHGGDVRVWSRPGRGSTFTIRLPEASQTPALAGTDIGEPT